MQQNPNVMGPCRTQDMRKYKAGDIVSVDLESTSNTIRYSSQYKWSMLISTKSNFVEDSQSLVIWQYKVGLGVSVNLESRLNTVQFQYKPQTYLFYIASIDIYCFVVVFKYSKSIIQAPVYYPVMMQ